jgi:hypothetical protein
MSHKFYRIAIAGVILALFLAACGGGNGTPTSTADANLVRTAAAQTADARLTELVALTPSALPQTATSTPNPTQTAAAMTAAAGMTQTAIATLTPRPSPTSTVPAPVTTGDAAAWVADITIIDNTDVTPGQVFVKTWRIQNTGVTTWTTDYDLVFVSGEPMGTTREVALPTSVSPGQQVDISVTMTAPTTLGTYTGYWKMRNSASGFFEYGVTVVIDVVSTLVTATTVPGTTATPTPTLSSNPITNLAMSVNPPVYIGACPTTFTFAATFTLNQEIALTYQLEGYSDTAGFVFTLPAAQTQTFAAGAHGLSFPLQFTSSGSGWLLLHITSPVNMSTNPAVFSLTCQP